jgi:hypothetical protein
MFNRTLIAVVTVALPLVLAACGNSRQLSASDYNDPRYDRVKFGNGDDMGTLGSDRLFSSKDDSQSGSGQGTGVGVNAYLWRGALETLSFMPLASADPFGGVIITDWYQPPSSSGERFKATAYILGRQLRADGVRVSIFRQVQQGGQWVDAPVDRATATDIENKVLARARELKTQSAGL